MNGSRDFCLNLKYLNSHQRYGDQVGKQKIYYVTEHCLIATKETKIDSVK